ncbi:MAG: hypothetical protein V7609_874 [Verrucomicrobiota bacterium]
MAEGWITASYNALNQPVAIWSPAYQGTDVVYFGYDPLGRCVKRWVSDSGDIYSNPATYFHYDGWNLLQEGSNAWGPARVYVHGNRIDEIVWSYNTFTGDQAFHHYDARGHATLLTDSVGNIIEQYEYDAFGQPYFYNAVGAATTVNGQPGSLFGNRFLFTGREWLSDLNLYDYRNRLYHPELGRFMQPDPKQFAAGDYNLYRYCHNDPINKTDPTGLDVNANFHDPSTEQFVSAQHLPEKRAEFSLAAHGNSSVIQDATGNLLGAESAVKAISSSKGFVEAKTIRLFVCDTGKGDNSIAQKIANITGKNVLAPTKWIWTDKKGGYSIYDGKTDPKTKELVKDLKDKGDWKLFKPGKQ